MAVLCTLTTDRITGFWGRFGPWLAVLALALPALARWWRADLPAGADTAIHLLRAAELDWAIRNGYLLPRWAPDLVFGFGYPLFHVHGPVAQYAIAALHALGLSFLAATLAAFALADLLGAFGAFVLARRLWRNDAAALLSSAAYVYSPYLLGSLYRGSPAEALALGLLPWLLWSFLQLIERPTVGRLALAAGLYALFPLLHNPSAVLASLALAAMVLARAASGAGRDGRLALWRLRGPALAVGLGLALSAFYWLAIPFEIGSIQIERAYAPNVLNYRFNFVPPRELLSAPQPFDPLLIGWHAPRSFGWPQLALAALGLAAWRRAGAARPALGLAIMGALVCGFLALPAARWVWDTVPGLSLVQFPARLLGPGSLALALVAGAVWVGEPNPFSPPLRPSVGRGGGAGGGGQVGAWPALAVAAIALWGLAWTFQHGDPLVPANPTLADLHAWERRTGSIGTTTAGEYLPVWVREVPPADKLAERYAQGAPIARLDPASLPEGATAMTDGAGLIRQRVTVAAPAAFDLVFDVFYFPGWAARVDGAPVAIRPTDPHGLIAVPVPAGAHTVELAFGTTPPRTAGAVVSAAGLLVWIGIVAVAVRGRAAPHFTVGRITRQGGGWGDALKGRFSARYPLDLLGTPPLRPSFGRGGGAGGGGRWVQRGQPGPVEKPTPVRWADGGRPALALSLLGLALLVFRLWAGASGSTWYARIRFDGARVAGLSEPRDLDFGGQMRLLGYEASRASVPSGSAVEVSLYWQAPQPLAEDYSTTLALVDAEGNVYVRENAQHPAGLPTSRWTAEQYGRDPHRLLIAEHMPPGTYRLVANVFRPSDLAALTAGVEIGALTVTPPERHMRAMDAEAAASRERFVLGTFGPIHLDWAAVGLAAVGVGDDLPVELYWHMFGAPAESYAAVLGLVNRSGEVVVEWTVAPLGTGFTTDQWRPGDVWLGRRAVRIPADLPGGEYWVTAALAGADGLLAEPAPVGQVQVVAPERAYAAPALAHTLSARFGDVAELAGWQLDGPRLTLAWRALGTPETRYTVFVHVRDAAGQLYSQRDAPPGSGLRPTTSWLPGEYVQDEYVLDLPPGGFSLAVGLYDQQTGARLLLPPGADQVVLTP